ncbi:ATP-binding protein [Kamptonema sp. PCC 6506]|uniref:ATP-binding protein n=1 Tax=Kamptonema sp. PCC 6506 TaxID=272129 RepID=UPI001F197FB3|nr:ATP-binding protein [Kamptonema sp. PCC 6506]
MSQQFCKMMGDEIIVESEVGVGSTFTLFFPDNVDYPLKTRNELTTNKLINIA